MNRLILIRHGKTIANETGIIQGQSNYPLSPNGIDETNQLKEKYQSLFSAIDDIKVSPLTRAQETAKILFETSLEKIKIDDLLTEVNPGILEGQLKKKVQQQYPNYYNIWQQRKDLDPILKAETGDELQARVLMFLEQFYQKDYNCAIVSHAGFLRSMINTIKNQDRQTNIDLDHQKIYVLEDIFQGIKIIRHDIAKNAEVLEWRTKEKPYILKKYNRPTTEADKKEQKLLSYLSSTLEVPTILGMADRKNYHLKVMKYLTGKNISSLPTKEQLSNTLEELYKLQKKLREYPMIEEKPVDMIQTLNEILKNTHNEEVKKYVEKILKDSYFKNIWNKAPKHFVHDDLHKYNILYDQAHPKFLDFEGVNIYPTQYQLGSYIAASILLEDPEVSLDHILTNWPETTNKQELDSLIDYRLLMGFSYFSKRLEHEKDTSDRILFNKYQKALRRKR